MADLEPLIRYRKHQLDEKQKHLARLYEHLDVLLSGKEKMLGDLEKENAYIKEDPTDIYALQNLSKFYQATKTKVARLNTDIEKAEARIEIAIEDMRITFGDLKKIEITHERRLTKERKALADKETKLFDEIGLEMHKRQKDAF